MLVGYNTNISYKDKVYHIQTEDSGQSNPSILTLLYSKGAILASKKTSYAHIIAEPDYQEQVRKLMKEQHKEMIKGLLGGKYTRSNSEEGEEGRNEAAEKEERATETLAGCAPAELVNEKEEKIVTEDRITKSLDDILLNYIMKRAKE
jgi:hypothetical protein